MNKKKRIIFRADGSSEMGLGHLVRSSALADMLKVEYECVLATRCRISSIFVTLKSSFSEIISLPDQEYYLEAQLMAETIPIQNLVILDGYNFDSRYQELLVNQGFDLFSIDDIHAFQFYSKIIINHAGGVSSNIYQAFPFTQFFLGPYYALLRPPFLKAALRKRSAINDKNCFICFGGADPDNKTLEILKSDSVTDFSGIDHFHVVVGNAFKYKAELQEFVQFKNNITLYNSLSSDELVAIMQLCSYAICSPSSIVYEYMSVGGVVFLEQIADNQKDILRFLLEQGLAFTLNDLHQLDQNRVTNAFAKQALYFDGMSDDRFRKLFRQYFDSKKLSVRKARKDDVNICFNWVNDLEVRAQSYNESAIIFEDHVKWFDLKLNDPNCYYYILELERTPVAQIRFQLSNNEAILSYLASREIRSKGMGTTILSKGIETFVQEYKQPVNIIGFVKKTNIASQRSFEKLPFDKEASKEYHESYKYSMHYGI